MFSFANPEFLYLLLLVPAIAGLYVLERIARKRKLADFGREDQVKSLMPDVSSRKPMVRLVLILLLITTAVVILARPRAGAAKKSTGNLNGIEVVVAMDVSNSMNASSTSDPQGLPRLQRSKMIMEKLIDRLRNDKVALVVFAGKPYMQMPMTIDGQSAKMFLNGIKTSMVPTQGTAIGSAIDLSMTAFTRNSKASKAIILITDAENFEDDAVEAAKRAKQNDIQVNVIGIGTNEGAPIPTDDGGYMTDESGQAIVTHLDEEKAQQIAKAGNGTYVQGNATDAVEVLDDTLKKLATTSLSQVTFTKNDEQFPVFAWIALILLIANVMLLNYKNPWLAKHDFFKLKSKKALSMALIATVSLSSGLFLAGCGKDDPDVKDESNKTERNHIRKGNKLFAEENYADAEVEYSKALEANPSSAIAAYNMGLAITRQAPEGDTTGVLQRADSLFTFAASVTKDKTLKSMAHYNMGNIAYNAQHYDIAINNYKESLRCVPSDDDARYNLRMAQLKLKEQQQQNQNQNQNQDKNQDKNQDQNKDKNQNQDQNKDNQDQNQGDQDKQQNGDQDKKQQQQSGQQQQGQPIKMDERSINQVLKAMQDKEKETQQKIYQMDKARQRQERQNTRYKW